MTRRGRDQEFSRRQRLSTGRSGERSRSGVPARRRSQGVAEPRGSHRDSVSDPSADIPLARRSRPQQPTTPRLASRLRWALFGSALVLASTAGLLLGPLRPWLQPAPVSGLNARLSADGRLLGHFPYPEAPATTLISVAPGLQLRREAGEAWLAMRQAAAADGVDLALISAFRSVALQRSLFFGVSAERNQSALMRARVSAPPGFSEHGTGFAVDIGDGQRPQTNLSQDFEATPAYAWLRANAARFHFQLSFPPDNPQGLNYEPWHWRYEGSTAALRLFEPAHRLARR